MCCQEKTALVGPPPAKCLEALYRRNTTLLPDTWMDPLSLEELVVRVRDSVKLNPALVPKRADNLDQTLQAALTNPHDDRPVFLGAFPTHSPQDLGIRYVRA